jgi:membrane-bound lytic murein transglycosylase D
LILIISFAPLLSQQKADKSTPKQTKKFGDEYTILDEKQFIKAVDSEDISVGIALAEKLRDRGLKFLESGDTMSAKLYFEEALRKLDQLASIPGIEKNSQYIELVYVIIDDYESYIGSIEILDDNTPIYIVRQKILQEIDKTPVPKTQVKKIDLTKPKPEKEMPTQWTAISATTIPLDTTEAVQRSINFLTNDKGRKFFTKWLERSTKWFPMMKKIASEENIPEEIIFLSMIESGLNPTVVSRAKAVGLWQFIRTTGEMYGLNKDASIWIDERRNPEKATRAAMRHLHDLYSQFKNWHFALAAYNCGAKCVERAISKSEVENPTFWDISQFLPRETRNYVPLYIATTIIALNPEAYNFDLDELNFHPEYIYDTYTINEPVALSTLAKCCEITEEDLKQLNPELIKNCTPPDLKEYTLKIPKGNRQKFIINYASLTPEEKQPWVNHTVGKKETIASIAQLYGVSKKEIMDANALESANEKLKQGKIIKIPINKVDYQDNDSASDDKTKSYDTENYTYSMHEVKKGETLYSIALRYGMNLGDLCKLNGIELNNENIEEGTKLKVAIAKSDIANITPFRQQDVKPAETNSPKIETKPKDPEPQPQTKIIKHTVKKGETLAEIADDYNTTQDKIKKDNRLKSGKVKSGQILKIETTNYDNSKISSTKSTTKTDKSIKKPEKKKTHKVKKGETLTEIAKKYNVSEKQLKDWNKNTIKGNKVLSGTTLKLYTTESSSNNNTKAKKSDNTKTKKSEKAAKAKVYKVKRGDSLADISRKFGVSISTLKKKNKNLSEKNLKAGQVIKIQ